MLGTELESKLVDRYVGLASLLEKTLPAGHPVAAKVEALRVEVLALDSEPEPEEEVGEDYQGALGDLVEMMEDWQRGIRDWSEVEEVLRGARAIL